jgi:hypothetical protein
MLGVSQIKQRVERDNQRICFKWKRHSVFSNFNK